MPLLPRLVPKMKLWSEVGSRTLTGFQWLFSLKEIMHHGKNFAVYAFWANVFWTLWKAKAIPCTA